MCTDPWYDFKGLQNSATAGHEVYQVFQCYSGIFRIAFRLIIHLGNLRSLSLTYQGTPAYICLALLDSPDMSGMVYADMMQEFFAPRVFVALGLEEEAMIKHCV